MTEELVEFLDRQFDFLRHQEGPAIFRELRRTIELLNREARLALLLEQARQETWECFERFEHQSEAFRARLVDIRNRYVTTEPSCDDSQTPRPAQPRELSPWLDTLAAFDAVAAGETLAGIIRDQENESDSTRVSQLIAILRRKFYRDRRKDDNGGKIDDRFPSLDPLQQEMLDLRAEYIRARRSFVDSIRTEPGSSLICLEAALEWLSTPRPPSFERQTQQLLDLLHFHPLLHTDYVYSERTHSQEEQAQVNRAMGSILDAAKRLHHGLRLRIGSTRSLLLIFERFKTRCELHDRERLAELAKRRGIASVAATTHPPRTRAEQMLTRELARYLFDQGLNPLSEVPVGVHRADLIGPDVVYVEAKQYTRANPKPYLLKGTRQVFEMMGKLRTFQYRLREAFYVIFRLGGPLVVTPREVWFSEPGWTLRPIVVDLAQASESGSRALPRIELTEAEIRSSIPAPKRLGVRH